MLRNGRNRTTSQSSSVMSDVELSSSARESLKVIPINNRKSKKSIIKELMLRRRKSSAEKNEELTTVKIEALCQLENTIKMADIIENKNQQIAELKLEVKSLKQNLIQCKNNLLESKEINKELMDKLQSLAQTNSSQKIDLENIRTEKLAFDILESPVTPNSSYSSYLKDIYENRERLLEECAQLRQTINEHEKRMLSMDSYISHLEASKNENYLDYKHIEETTVDNRSTSDLLAIIRRHIDEKMVWMEYAIKITQDVVEKYPQLFEINQDDNEDETQHNQRCSKRNCIWSKYVISILKIISRSSPLLLKDLLKAADTNQKMFIESKLK